MPINDWKSRVYESAHLANGATILAYIPHYDCDPPSVLGHQIDNALLHRYEMRGDRNAPSSVFFAQRTATSVICLSFFLGSFLSLRCRFSFVRFQELMDHLNDWLTTLHLRAPRSTVLLCGTHKDKILPNNLLAKSTAWLRRSPSIETIMEDVEQSIKKKYEEWKRGRRPGLTSITSIDGGLQVERGVQLVSSSPTWPYLKSGLPDLQERLKKCGNGSRWLIPPSWCHALVALDAVRDGVDPVEAVRRYLKREDPLPVVTTEKRSWIRWEVLRLHWKHVQDCVDLPAELKPKDPDFALESAMDLR